MTDLDASARKELDRVARRLDELVDHLREFRAEYALVGADETMRFELMCRHMFQTFTYRDAPTAEEPASPVPNLDTGDAVAHPFPPFVDALMRETSAVTVDAHHYYGAESVPALAAAALQFLRRERFPLKRPLSELRVLPGAGTVQIYDALCKVLVGTPGDTVLVPQLGYGFFLTQPCRVGGRVAAVGCDERGAVTAASLAAAIEEQNQLLWEEWKRDSEVLFDRAVRRLGAGIATWHAGAEGILSDIRKEMAKDPAGWRSTEVSNLLAEAAPEFAAPAARSRALTLLRPPAVVAFLHIQPAVSGHVYTDAEAAGLAAVLDRGDVAAIEDVAYHSIRCRLRDLASLQGRAAEVYTLLGLSKPMAIANMRLGLLFVDEANAERPHRALESTTGYISALLQRALATALRADGYDAYIADHSWGPAGYERRAQVMRTLLAGGGADGQAREIVRRAALRAPELQPFVEDFLQAGLSRWLQPLKPPESGFFQLVSCAPLLAEPAFKRLGITSSFDVFALLAYIFDLRTIPEEGMGPGTRPGNRLRLAFSPDPEIVAHLFLRAYAGLTSITTATSPADPTGREYPPPHLSSA